MSSIPTGPAVRDKTELDVSGRDVAFCNVMGGAMTVSEAEALAVARDWPPFTQPPEAKAAQVAFDKPAWPLELAAGWVAYRDPQGAAAAAASLRTWGTFGQATELMDAVAAVWRAVAHGEVEVSARRAKRGEPPDPGTARETLSQPALIDLVWEVGIEGLAPQEVPLAAATTWRNARISHSDALRLWPPKTVEVVQEPVDKKGGTRGPKSEVVGRVVEELRLLPIDELHSSTFTLESMVARYNVGKSSATRARKKARAERPWLKPET